MKQASAYLIMVSLIIMVSCGKYNVTTGIIGTVEYTKGDCMPVIDVENREWDKYNGNLYFVIKDEWDSLGYDEQDQLLYNSFQVKVKSGKLSTEVPPEAYYVMPEVGYEFFSDNMITIIDGEVIKKDYRFFICTSY